jgi:protein ImuA
MPASSLSRQTTLSGLPHAIPGVWQADVLDMGARQAQPSGYALLDAQLPGGGWPVGALSEVLQPLPGQHEWQLVLPALAQATAARTGAVVAVAPPYEPFGPALHSRGLTPDRVCVVRPGVEAAGALWAAEQALRCPDVLAVMAWLPQVVPAALRRLQLAAAQQHQLLWVFRPLEVAAQASPALLRLQVRAAKPLPLQAGQGAGLVPGMVVEVLKRRGPPLVHPLTLPGCHPRLAQALTAQAERRQAAQHAAGASRAGPAVLPGVGQEGRSGHALDRVAAAAME